MDIDMDTEFHTETWFFYGICDLYFSFHSEEWVFDYHSAFFSIMALEKHLKAFLIFHKKPKLITLSEDEIKEEVLTIARGYSHDFRKMTREISAIVSSDAFSKLLQDNYDGYNGEELIDVLKDAYMETRYPTSRSVSQSFPIGEPGMYHNPLGSSGIHHFIQSVCQFLIANLSEQVDLERILKNVTGQYQHLEPFGRFKNIYLPGKWP
jgi:hypothetical protein